MLNVFRQCYRQWQLLLPFVLATAAWAQAPGSGPRPPREALAAFDLADPALMIELVAAEPDVTSPVAIAWDEDRRLYVAEMIDYPVATASGRIRRLEDRDGDGQYEHATIFAEGLPFPNSVMPCFGGVLVTAAPNIWFLRDRDGDGRADIKQVVLTGFGEGNTQLRVNGLSWGLDNQIYAANGRSDGEVHAPGEPVSKALSIRRRDLRFRLKARPEPGPPVRIEAIAGFSQFGLAHDDWGNRFPSWNTIPVRHVVLEQQSLDRNPYLAETSSIASILDLADGGRIFGISGAQPRFNRESVAFFNASCGPAIERGDWLPTAYHGNAFICEPLTNLVHRRVLEPAGVTFIARRAEPGREFLASSDPAFRPVNLATAPDGSLTIVDMYRELVEHPQFVPEPARGAVDFRRWHDRGRIWRVRPKAASLSPPRRLKLSGASVPELVDLLGHANGWWRMTAQRLLVERQDRAAVPLLTEALKDSRDPRKRLHALWSLAGLDSVDADALAQALADPHSGLREHALRVASAIESQQPTGLIPTARLVSLAQDSSIRVRFQAALALGDRCRLEPAALDALGKIAVRDADDPWMRLAILSGLADSSLAFIPLCDSISSASGSDQLLAQTAAIVGVRRHDSELAALLEIIASRADRGDKEQSGSGGSTTALTLLAGLAEGLERSGPPLHALMAAPPPELKSHLDRMAKLWDAARALAVSNQSVEKRSLALDVVARGRPDLAEAIVPALMAVDQPFAIQAAAARAVARAGRPALAASALERWNDLALSTRRELLAAITGSPGLAESLIQALERRIIAPAELSPATRDALKRHSDSALSTRASAMLARFAPPERSAVLARYQPALALTGDSGRGAILFDKNCLTCHQHQGRGHKVGPDLSGIAGRAPEALLVDVLDPNRHVEPDYVTLTVATRRGQLLSGLLAEESATTLRLRRADAVEETLLRSEVQEIRSTSQSLMPEGLEQNVNLQDMADLIAFMRQGSRPSRTADAPSVKK